MKHCKFCQPLNAFGEHSVAEYRNPDDATQCITVDVYGGFLTIGFMMDGEKKTLEQRIEYCPICGRQYEEEERNDK